MKIYLIRHGESASDVKEKYDGDYDDHLTESGLKDAETIAEKLLDSQIQVIFSSPKIRALETAEVLKNILQCEVVVLDDMSEQDIYGAYPDLSKDFPEEEYRRLGEVLADREGETAGVESYARFKERIIRCFAEIIKQDYQAVAVITHGGPIRCILREVLKLGEMGKMSNGAIIELENGGEGLKVLRMDGVVIK